MSVDSLFDLTGRVALVTGASSGFGEHFAKVLAENGAKVVVGARRLDRLEKLVEDIKSAGGEALAVAMDVTDGDIVSAAFDSAETTLGVVDIVVNNAGVADPKKALVVDEDSWDFVVDTNLKAVWRVATEGAQRMVKAELPGSIVNIASILGLRVAVDQSSYAAAKAGVVQLTKSMALELARHHIRVNAICPGYYKTEINEDFFNTENGQAYIKQTPARRLGEMSELTGPLLLLASGAGSFVTGVALPVDGGHLLKSL
ncbi:MAG: SDR family NAD(P)-dependent oxidoreductase [Pseudomonadales bacterium]